MSFKKIFIDEDGCPVYDSDNFYESQEDYEAWQSLIEYYIDR